METIKVGQTAVVQLVEQERRLLDMAMPIALVDWSRTSGDLIARRLQDVRRELTRHTREYLDNGFKSRDINQLVRKIDELVSVIQRDKTARVSVEF